MINLLRLKALHALPAGITEQVITWVARLQDVESGKNVDWSDTWTEQDIADARNVSLSHLNGSTRTFEVGRFVIAAFPAAQITKARHTVTASSHQSHNIVVGNPVNQFVIRIDTGPGRFLVDNNREGLMLLRNLFLLHI